MFLGERSKGKIPNEVPTYSGTSIDSPILCTHPLPNTIPHAHTQPHVCNHTYIYIYNYTIPNPHILVADLSRLKPNKDEWLTIHVITEGLGKEMNGIEILLLNPQFNVNLVWF